MPSTAKKPIIRRHNGPTNVYRRSYYRSSTGRVVHRGSAPHVVPRKITSVVSRTYANTHPRGGLADLMDETLATADFPVVEQLHFVVEARRQRRKFPRTPRVKVCINQICFERSLTRVKVRELLRWMGRAGGRDYRQEYLNEFIRRKGRGGNRIEVCACAATDIDGDAPMGDAGGTSERAKAIYRCVECHPTRLECEACCVARHSDLPCHVVKVRSYCSYSLIPG